MTELQNRERALIESDYGHTWLGNLVTKLGADYNKVYCRGSWNGLLLSENGNLCFDTETAWGPMDEVFELIKKVYPSLNIYYSAEEDGMGLFCTNDREGKYFPDRYRVDAKCELEYFRTIKDVCQYVSGIIGKTLNTKEELDSAVEEWNDKMEEQDNFDDQISIDEFTVENNDFTS